MAVAASPALAIATAPTVAAAPSATNPAVRPEATPATPENEAPTRPRLPPMPVNARLATSLATDRRCISGVAAADALATRRSAASPEVPTASRSRRALSAPSALILMPTVGRDPLIPWPPLSTWL